MNQITPEDGGGPSPGVQSRGTGTATRESNCQRKNISGTFQRTGRIEIDRQALMICYRSFHADHIVFIGARDLQRLLERGSAVVVVRIREGIDGTTVIENMGKAWRSRSGKALMIRCIDSQGEIIASWAGLQRVIAGQVRAAPLSRITGPPKPAPSPMASQEIRRGLSEGF